jgi:hypothetical protein
MNVNNSNGVNLFSNWAQFSSSTCKFSHSLCHHSTPLHTDPSLPPFQCSEPDRDKLGRHQTPDELPTWPAPPAPPSWLALLVSTLGPVSPEQPGSLAQPPGHLRLALPNYFCTYLYSFYFVFLPYCSQAMS